MFDLPWFVTHEARFIEQCETQQLPHASLLSGVTGIGKYAFSQHMAKYLLCLQRKNQQACGACRSCQLITNGTHPDLLCLHPEGVSQTIGIGQVREAIAFTTQTPMMGRFRLVVVQTIERMNVAASNAVLKVLEEPPEQTLFLLTTNQLSIVLPTIRSRCVVTSITTPSASSARQWLGVQTCSEQDMRFALLLAGGAPLLAKNTIEMGRLPLYQKSLTQWVQFVLGQQELTVLVKDWMQYDAIEWLDKLALFALEISKIHHDISSPVFSNLLGNPLLIDLRRQTFQADWIKHYQLLIKRKKSLQMGYHLNKQLLFEEIACMFETIL